MKIIDIFDDGFEGFLFIKECTNKMFAVNVKIVIDNYLTKTVLVEKKALCGDKIPFSIPRKSLGNIFEIYFSTDFKIKGSVTGWI